MQLYKYGLYYDYERRGIVLEEKTKREEWDELRKEYYTEEELKEWLPKIEKIAQKTTDQYIFMNNHYKGKAVKNALMLIKLLKKEIKAGEIKEKKEEKE